MIKPAWELVAEAKARVQNLTVDQVEGELSNGAVLVDLREPHEREAIGTIPGAIHVPRGELEFVADPATALHRSEFQEDARLILHCALGGRSALAADTLQQMGYKNVAHLDGGIKAWIDADKPVEDR